MKFYRIIVPVALGIVTGLAVSSQVLAMLGALVVVAGSALSAYSTVDTRARQSGRTLANIVAVGCALAAVASLLVPPGWPLAAVLALFGLVFARLSSTSQSQYVLVSYGVVPDGLGASIVQGACASCNVPTLNDWRQLTAGARIIIIGTPRPEQLRSECAAMRKAGHMPMVVKNALGNFEELRAVLGELNEHRQMQLTTAKALASLLRFDMPFVYAFPKSDNTGTVAVFFGGSRKVLTITRRDEPYKGWLALPGGFLNVLLESLEQCVVREASEEVKLDLTNGTLVALGVASSPDRDDRGHVIDHRYALFVPPQLEAQVLASIQAGDDALKAEVLDVDEVLRGSVAFDHAEIIKAGVTYFAAHTPAQ